MENGSNLFTKLPYIALLKILNHLNQEDILNFSYISKTIFRLINSNSELSRVKSMQLFEYNEIELDIITYRLERLDLSGSEVDDSMLFDLAHKEKLKLKAIDLGFCKSLSNKHFHYFFTLQKDLTYIGLAHCPITKEVNNYQDLIKEG